MVYESCGTKSPGHSRIHESVPAPNCEEAARRGVGLVSSANRIAGHLSYPPPLRGTLLGHIPDRTRKVDGGTPIPANPGGVVPTQVSRTRAERVVQRDVGAAALGHQARRAPQLRSARAQPPALRTAHQGGASDEAMPGAVGHRREVATTAKLRGSAWASAGARLAVPGGPQCGHVDDRERPEAQRLLQRPTITRTELCQANTRLTDRAAAPGTAERPDRGHNLSGKPRQEARRNLDSRRAACFLAGSLTRLN
mmetsp:Transcript_56818/g.166297  ORF Transcript_56818/g.166297 Transcript_56818/m.166297 type:complete len:253 (-) Transcript_56818:195-953(-)